MQAEMLDGARSTNNPLSASPPNEGYDANRPLAFFHIPKSAGTSLSDALLSSIGLRNEVHGWDRSLFGDYDDFASWKPDILPYVFLRPDELKAEARFISGHIAETTLRARYPSTQIITIVRDPYTRLLSLWVFWRGRGDISGDFGTYAERVYLARRTLQEFLIDPRVAAQTDNVCARMLLWPHELIPGDRFIPPENDDEILHVALRRLEQFDFVGLYEDPQWKQDLERWLGRALPLQSKNVTATVPELYKTDLDAELSPQSRELLQQRTRIDEKIWAEVADRILGAGQSSVVRDQCRAADLSKFAKLLR